MADKPICSIEGCSNNTKTRGLCQKHYMRLVRHGSPLVTAYRRAGSTDPAPSTKTCTGCAKEKLIGEFGCRPERPSGTRSLCRACARTQAAEYKANNPDKIAAYRLANPEIGRKAVAKYRETNKQLMRERQRVARDRNRDSFRERDRERYQRNRERYRAADRAFYEANKEAMRQRARDRRAADPDKAKEDARRSSKRFRSTPRGKLENAIRGGVNAEIQRGSKRGRKTFALLGFTPAQLMSHIERQFLPGMSWSNHGRSGWHIDHIIPLASFAYSTPDDPDFAAAWAITNLRPLWSAENHSKGGKRLHLI